MRKLSESEVAAISGGIIDESVGPNCALSSAALVVSAFAGPCLDNKSNSSN